MKMTALCAGWLLCSVLAGCAVPQRDALEIAVPAQAPQPLAEPAPPMVGAPSAAEAARIDPPGATASVVTPAVVRERRLPAYPSALVQEGIEGQVIASFFVDAQGLADEVRIERSPHPLLSKAVTDALKGWRFDPARAADGSPVRTRMRLPFRFQVE